MAFEETLFKFTLRYYIQWTILCKNYLNCMKMAFSDSGTSRLKVTPSF